MASGKENAAAAAAVRSGLDSKPQDEKHHLRHRREVAVLDGKDIAELVDNHDAFGRYVDRKFEELDRDHNGTLSAKELEPVVADIGTAIGLPAQGSSPDSDHIYSEVIGKFTNGKENEVTNTKFKEVLSDMLLGMAEGLKRDPIVILRIDGEDLREFVDGPSFEPESNSMFSRIESENVTLQKCIMMALEQLTIDHGMPPPSDAWVFSNIIQPALQSLSTHNCDQSVAKDSFLVELKKVVDDIAKRLKEHPVIVAHSENTFDGSCIRRLMSNKFELDKMLDTVWKDQPKNHNHKLSKEYLHLALDFIAPPAGLPPYGAVNQVDGVVNEAFKLVNADDGKPVDEAEFKKLMGKVLGAIMLQLEGNPISVSSNSVVHEPIAKSSALLPTSSPETGSTG